MTNRPTVWMIAAAIGVAPHIAAGQEHAGHPPSPRLWRDLAEARSAKAGQMAGEAPSVDPAACTRGAQQALPVIERARTRVETARQANSPPELRAAIDDFQSALSQMAAQLTPCAPPVSGFPRQGSGQALPMPQDHSNMTMPMDHSKMAMPPTTSKPETTKPSAGAAMPRDHSKMATPPTTSKPETTKPPAGAAPPMDHSKMAMPSGAPEPGTDKPAATPGNAKLPVMPLEKVLDPRCAKTIDVKTAPRATFDGKVYYFCSTADRDRFRKDPAAYLKKPQ